MPYRERFAWLSLVAMAVTFGPYIVYVAGLPTLDAPLPNFPMMKLFALTILVQAAMLIAGQTWFRLRYREDARARPDERDRAIDRRSIRAAYYVLVVAVILVGMILPFVRSGWALVNAAALSVTVAEIVRCTIAVISYRRGWNE
jgi:hypothetical protein